MTHLLLLSALVILACVLCNKLSSKLGVPTLLAFILLGMFFGCLLYTSPSPRDTR